MSRQEGVLIECDRCGEHYFSKFIREEGIDGGYTRKRVYEPLPEEWLYTSEIGYLCPACAGEFKAFVKTFMKEEEKIAPIWRQKP